MFEIVYVADSASATAIGHERAPDAGVRQETVREHEEQPWHGRTPKVIRGSGLLAKLWNDNCQRTIGNKEVVKKSGI